MAGGIDCQRADGSFGDAERPVIDGGICACHAAVFLPLGWGAFSPSIESQKFLFGAAGTGARPVWCCPVQFIPVSSCPLSSGPPGRWRLAMPGAAGWLDWLGD
ncbi:hypothetical protein ACFOY8_10235 [Thalassospira xianhensis]|uniref:hypothetical protein n=1 Tax=Thalassospira xianhensis TaxID=478503 RepID=UPI00362240A3